MPDLRVIAERPNGSTAEFSTSSPEDALIHLERLANVFADERYPVRDITWTCELEDVAVVGEWVGS